LERSEAKRLVAGNIEAGTELGNGTLHVAMTPNYRIWENLKKVEHHLLHLGFLCLGAGVGGSAVGTQAAFVADADAVVVVGAAVGADLIYMSGLCEAAISLDVEVVPDVFESPFSMITAKLIYGVVDVLRRCRTMYDDEVY
jgi:hypothetical protein